MDPLRTRGTEAAADNEFCAAQRGEGSLCSGAAAHGKVT